VKFERPRSMGSDGEVADAGLDAELEAFTLKTISTETLTTATIRRDITAVRPPRRIDMPEVALCHPCSRSDRERFAPELFGRLGTSQLASLIEQAFAAELAQQRPFPTIIVQGGDPDADLELLVRGYDVQLPPDPGFSIRWRPVLALEGRLRRRDGSVAWRSFSEVRGAWQGEIGPVMRDAFSEAARDASKALVADLLKSQQ
jgi:hypothetical protein